MTITTFALKPFFSVEPEPFGITGTISCKDGELHICYTLSGPLDRLMIPLTAQFPERRDNLWEESCFELFFAEPGSEAYWEVNLAPSGHWNVYNFDCYRQGMQMEDNVSSIPCSFVRRPQTFILEAVLDLGCLRLTEKHLQVNVSGVFLSKSNKQSYWALAHPCGKPDFHDRKGFILTL